MVKPILDDNTSPLDLQFRILPDLSALKQDTFQLQPFKRDGFWYYATLYSLTCYTSLKYRGRGQIGYHGNYTTGSPLWSISANFGYQIPEAEAIPNSNRPFRRNGQSVYYRTEQPGKKYEFQYVDIEDKFKNLPKFLGFFAELNTRFAQVSTWVDQRLDAKVICECGHAGKIDHSKLSNRLHKVDAMDSLKSYLICTSCKRSAAVTVMPLYGEYTPEEYIHNTAWAKSGTVRTEVPSVARNPDLEEMYNTLGGDGERAAYLSDGAYLSPNGEISED